MKIIIQKQEWATVKAAAAMCGAVRIAATSTTTFKILPSLSEERAALILCEGLTCEADQTGAPVALHKDVIKGILGPVEIDADRGTITAHEGVIYRYGPIELGSGHYDNVPESLHQYMKIEDFKTIIELDAPTFSRTVIKAVRGQKAPVDSKMGAASYIIFDTEEYKGTGCNVWASWCKNKSNRDPHCPNPRLVATVPTAQRGASNHAKYDIRILNKFKYPKGTTARAVFYWPDRPLFIECTGGGASYNYILAPCLMDHIGNPEINHISDYNTRKLKAEIEREEAV